MGSYKVCSVFTEHSLGLWDIKQKNFESHLNMENCIAFSERKSKQRAVIWTCSAVRWRVTSNAHRMACHCFKHNGSVCLGVAVFLRTLCSCKSKGMWILMGNSVSITTSTPERHGERQTTSCMEFYVDSECGGTTLWSSVSADTGQW